MPIFAILVVLVFVLFLVLGIAFSFRQIDNEHKKESKLSVFEHPSNFEKPPVEWVQKPNNSEEDKTSKKL